MNYILDTHTLIWFLNGDPSLSKKALKTIQSDNANNFISIASLWEIAIKLSLKKLEMDFPFEDLVTEITKNGFQILPISLNDTFLLIDMPFHHRDPFDRLIIA